MGFLDAPRGARIYLDANIWIYALEAVSDAIHAASALAAGCTTFLTNDKQFRTVRGLHTVLLSQAAMALEEEE